MVIASFLVLLGAVFVQSLLAARSDLRTAAASAHVLKQAIVVGDQPTATAALSSLQLSSSKARSHSDGPLWRIASHVPVIGDDFASVSLVSDVLADAAQRVLPPLVDISTVLDLNTFAPHHGKVDLAALATLNEPIADANDYLAADRRRLETIDLEGLSGLVEGPVGTFKKAIDEASDAARVAHDVLGLVPTMVGGKDRTYLLVFQNNAEVRSTGGIAGAYLLARVSEGHVELDRQGNAAMSLPEGAFALTSEEKDLYGERLAGKFIDTNLTPEFPRTAAILQEMVARKLGVKVDGVISVDPVAMSYVLRGIGPLKVDGKRVTSANAIEELLNKVYLDKDYAHQDVFFQDTAAPAPSPRSPTAVATPVSRSGSSYGPRRNSGSWSGPHTRTTRPSYPRCRSPARSPRRRCNPRWASISTTAAAESCSTTSTPRRPWTRPTARASDPRWSKPG